MARISDLLELLKCVPDISEGERVCAGQVK